MLRPIPSIVFALTCVCVLTVPAVSAQAASVSVSATADPLEDRPITFTAGAQGDGDARYVYAKVRPDDGRACAPSYRAETGTGPDLFFRDVAAATEVRTFEDPGAFVVCAYLSESSSDVPVARGELRFAVRANRAALAVQAPAAATVGTAFPVRLAGSTELGRDLYAKYKPVGAGACGPSRAADPSASSFAFAQAANGAFALPRLVGPIRDPGQYRLCAWLQEGSSDPVAEAAATAVVDVRAPVPLLRGLDVTPRSFAARTGGRSITDSFRGGAQATYTLEDTAAGVRFTVRARRSGRRVGSSCRRPTRRNRGGRRCVRYVPVRGGFTHRGTRGYNSFRFSGRVGGKRLARGRYRLYASPRNATGRGQTLRRSFRITRR